MKAKMQAKLKKKDEGNIAGIEEEKKAEKQLV